MKGETPHNQHGFFQLIVILVLLIVILSLLGVSLSALFQNKTLQENFSFIGTGFKNLWGSGFGTTVETLWSFVWEGVFQKLFSTLGA